MLKIALISGTYSLSSRVNGLIEWIQTELESDAHLTIIHVHQLSAEALITAKVNDPTVATANRLIDESDGVIVVTPTFKASFSGILKTYLDLLPKHALEGKTVLPLAVGGSPAHLLMLKYALGPVLSELGAHSFIKDVYLLDTQIQHVAPHHFSLDTDARERLTRAIKALQRTVRQAKIAQTL
ncbi:NADPH-dependent FMN reductase [Sporolactobacillus terrae]|uniref:NADPH-dependent FMN reductase n=1 Tax=Sporolactobacillus terrae TaxID=269673 RepID=UPI00048DAAC4|nr:NADPH-dependent FMN reductase [Sporolactobacillus terrae]